jgi:hypothetical protein
MVFCQVFLLKKRKNNATFIDKQRDYVNKAKPIPLSAVAVEISSPKKP